MGTIKGSYCRNSHGQWKKSQAFPWIKLTVTGNKCMYTTFQYIQRCPLRTFHSISAFLQITHLLVLIWSSEEYQHFVQFHSLGFTHHRVWPKDMCVEFYSLYSAWVHFTCMCRMRDVCYIRSGSSTNGNDFSAHT